MGWGGGVGSEVCEVGVGAFGEGFSISNIIVSKCLEQGEIGLRDEDTLGCRWAF